jgi:hypothetical protein
MIPLGDIDLQHEIRLNNRTGSVRRVYAARIEGRQSNVTVAMYQGHRAEEVCHPAFQTLSSNNLRRNGGRILLNTCRFGQCLATTLSRLPGALNYTISHPNIFQIYGAASSGSIRATLFPDGESLD